MQVPDILNLPCHLLLGVDPRPSLTDLSVFHGLLLLIVTSAAAPWQQPTPPELVSRIRYTGTYSPTGRPLLLLRLDLDWHPAMPSPPVSSLACSNRTGSPRAP